MYKYPQVPILTIVGPLIMLGLINLAIFFQGPALANRIASLSTLLLAIVAFVPVIRKQIPPSF
jgi:hypothetical protein